MTIRECAEKICRENGMADDEIAAFLKFNDENSTNASIEECGQRTVENLSERGQGLFMKMMRWIIPMQVQRFRDKTNQQTTIE